MRDRGRKWVELVTHSETVGWLCVCASIVHVGGLCACAYIST